MAPIPKKTYSRRNNDLHDSCIEGKENVDPFDELLSSPLKQDVQFKPLSFWTKKVKQLESKNKSKKSQFELYQTSDSDDPSSPFRGKRKPKSRSNTKKLKLHDSNRCSVDSLSRRPLVGDLSSVSLRKNCKYFSSGSRISDDSLIYIKKKIEDSSVALRKPRKFFSCSRGEVNVKNGGSCGSDSFGGKCSGDSQDLLKFLPLEESVNFLKSEDDLKMSVKLRECEIQRDSGYWEQSLDSMGFNVSDSLGLNTILEAINNESKLKNNLESTSVLYINDSMEETRCVDSSKAGRQTVLYPNEDMEETCIEGPYCKGNEESGTVVEFQNISNNFSSSKLDVSQYGTFLMELSEVEDETTVLNETQDSDNSLRDDTFGSFSPEESTIIQNTLMLETKNEGGSDGIQSDLPSQNISSLTNKISDMSISNKTVRSPTLNKSSSDSAGGGIPEDDREGLSKISSDTFPFITTRRRCYYSNRLKTDVPSEKEDEKARESQETSSGNETDTEEDSDKDLECPSVIMKDGTSINWDRCSYFENPVFESTRMFDNGQEKERMSLGGIRRSGFDGTESLDSTLTLKPGKKWLRSMSVLRQLRNGNITGSNLESTKIKGRAFESFVQDMLEMQNEVSEFSRILTAEGNGNSHRSCVFNSTSNFQDDEEKNESVNVSKGSDKTLLNHTVIVCQPEKVTEKSSAFRSALGLEINESITKGIIVGEAECTAVHAKDYILKLCRQKDILPFEDYFNERTLQNCKKIGEGVYGEVFMYNDDTVIKIMPIEGSQSVNGEPQKSYEEIISEIMITSKLSDLRHERRNRTNGFTEARKCWLVRGKYPKILMSRWNEFDRANGSENDSPVMFGSNQLYIVLELAHGGKDLESFVFTTSEQSLSIFIQTAFSLAAAERALEFEHRDLHWGNVLIARTRDKFMKVWLDNVEYSIPTKGVKVTIIDYTLSRMSHDGCFMFNDLSVDPTLFQSNGDYQFEIYRMMRRETNDNWSLFKPRTNIFWLHYMIDKIIHEVRYKSTKTKSHREYMKDLQRLEPLVLKYRSSLKFVLSDPMKDLLSNF